MIYNYAKSGGPPDCWRRLFVVNRETGEEIAGVIECNADEGWLIREVHDSDGYIMTEGEGADLKIKTERLEGLFEIRERIED